jgi:phage protein U
VSGNSFQRFDTIPSAILFDGVVPLPIYAVTQMSLNEAYHLPPLGTNGAQTIVSTHDDTVSLQGVLVGQTRFGAKALLETLADTSKRGTKLFVVGPKMSGLVLITAMTIRTNMQITKLTFGASSAKRQTLDVGIDLSYVPPASALASKLLDLAGSVVVGALADAGGD